MGKKSRAKSERRTSTGVCGVRQAIQQANYDHRSAQLVELHGLLTREHIHALNSRSFSHPENLVKIEKTFGPMEQWLAEQERTGEADVMRDGTVVFCPDWDEGYYPVGDSFITVADTFELIAADKQIPDGTDGLRKLGKRIKADMPLDSASVAAAKKSLAWIRSVTMSISPYELHNFIEVISTRAEFVRLGLLEVSY